MSGLGTGLPDTTWADAAMQRTVQDACRTLGLSAAEATAAGRAGCVTLAQMPVELGMSIDGAALVLRASAGAALLRTPQDRQQALRCGLTLFLNAGLCLGRDLENAVLTLRLPIDAACTAEAVAAAIADVAATAAILRTMGLAPLNEVVSNLERKQPT
jgi:hypothetical protein